MKLNKKLLPIKAHFFLSMAGYAPIYPFIPIIAKDLGFSSVAVGWIYAIYPILTIFIKPVVGSIADKYKCQKRIFVISLVAQLVSCYFVQWVPPLPTSNAVYLDCKDSTIKTCSEHLIETCYANKILEELNSTISCKLQVSQKYNDLSTKDHRSLLALESSASFLTKVDNGVIEDSCLLMKLNSKIMQYPQLSSKCSEQEMSAELFCEKTALKELIKKPAGNGQVFFNYQYWLLFTLVVSFRIMMSVSISAGDAICFSFLDNKPENFGLQRLWGAVGWGLMSIISGYIVDYMSSGKSGKDFFSSFLLMVLFGSADIFICVRMKVEQIKKSESIMKDVKKLLKNTKICIFIAWCIISGVYTSFVWNFLFWFVEDLASISGCESKAWIKTLEGLLLTVQCYGGEIPFYFISGWVFKKVGYVNSMTAVLFAFGARFLLYSSLTNPWWMLPIESLHGITFGIFYATMVTYASVISPPGTEVTIQNIVGALFEGAGTSLGGILGGYLFEVIGPSQTFFYLGCSAIAFGILHILCQGLTKETVYNTVATEQINPEKENNEDTGIVF